MLSERIRRVGFSPTLAVNDLARRMRAEGVDIIDFSAGQPDFPTPLPVKEAGKRAIDEDQTRYTANAGMPELRRAIADTLRDERGLTYDPEAIVVSPGAKASLYFAFMSLLDRGDRVIVPSPYWTSYPEQIRLAGGEPIFVACGEENGFKLTAEQLDRAAEPGAKALILNYPSNPTGASYTEEELASVAEVCVRRGIWILADEIYSRLLYDGKRFTSIARLGSEVRERTLVIDGMSKSYSMTGWRVGYTAGPPEVIAAIGKLQSHSTSNVTSISQWASVAALEMSAEELAPRVREFQERRDEIVGRLRAIPGVSCCRPDGAFYVFPDFSGVFTGEVASGEALSRYLLEKAEVAVVPGEAFGSKNHLRLSYAVSIESVRTGMDRIVTALAELSAA